VFLPYIRGSCVEILDAFVGRTVHGGGEILPPDPQKACTHTNPRLVPQFDYSRFLMKNFLEMSPDMPDRVGIRRKAK